MKKLIFITFLVISSNVLAQPTQGQVFNFSIGDVFETKTHGSLYPLYQLDTIVSKTINGDSIYYTIHRNYLADGPTPYSGQSVDYFSIDITQYAVFTLPVSTCAPTVDTVYVGDCGQTIWHRETYFDTCSFDPPMWSADLTEGLGGEYYWYWDPTNPNPSFTIQHELIYSNTAQWGECGIYFSLFVGVDELNSVERKLVKVVDLLGREIEDKPNSILIYIYSNGITERVIHTE